MAHQSTVKRIKIDKPLKQDSKYLLLGLRKTRRVKRNLCVLAKRDNLSVSTAQEKWGTDGQFYFGTWSYTDSSIIDNNTPPATQPSIHCCWNYDEETSSLILDSSDNSFAKEWLEWLINNIFAVRGYKLNGDIILYAHDINDMKRIIVTNNEVETQSATITWVDDDIPELIQADNDDEDNDEAH